MADLIDILLLDMSHCLDPLIAICTGRGRGKEGKGRGRRVKGGERKEREMGRLKDGEGEEKDR